MQNTNTNQYDGKMGFIVRRMNVDGRGNPGDEGRGEWVDGREASWAE